MWISISIRNFMLFPFLLFLERSEQSSRLQRPSSFFLPKWWKSTGIQAHFPYRLGVRGAYTTILCLQNVINRTQPQRAPIQPQPPANTGKGPGLDKAPQPTVRFKKIVNRAQIRSVWVSQFIRYKMFNWKLTLYKLLLAELISCCVPADTSI